MGDISQAVTSSLSFSAAPGKTPERSWARLAYHFKLQPPSEAAPSTHTKEYFLDEGRPAYKL